MSLRTRPSGWRLGKSLYEHRAHLIQHGSVLKFMRSKLAKGPV